MHNSKMYNMICYYIYSITIVSGMNVVDYQSYLWFDVPQELEPFGNKQTMDENRLDCAEIKKQ